MNMTKREIREALGLPTDTALADFFGVTKAAVSLWPDAEPIPSGRQWQLRALRPDLFEKPSKSSGKRAVRNSSGRV